ncbi:MAG TPA: GMC family oxidoreductase [Acidobacteriaceae bacterium]|nr:GMC family oxidoreductase [Acidobacteriaceae bacterium]
MIRDLREGSPQPSPQADVLIVGAGAAGIVLAVELARLGRNVLLLEAGGKTLEESTQDPYQTDLSGLPHRGVHEGRVRMHGGTTNKWGGQILELEAADFEPHPWIPGSGWPFPKAELAPHYARALELEGVAGSLRDDREVWQALHETPPTFPQLELYTSRWCPEPNFARLHRQVLEVHPRIQVWLHANVVQLILDDHQAAIGLRCRTLTGQEATFHADRYIFSLGTVESNRFFLQPRLSGALPWNQSGLLGRHFQDHIDSDAATVRPKDPKAFHQIFDSIFLNGYKYNPKLRLTRAAQQKHKTLAVGGTVFSVSDVDEALTGVKTTAKHLLRGRLGEVTGTQIASLLRHTPLVARQTYRYAVQHRSFHPADAAIRLRVHCEQQPDSASTITLAPERDQFGLLRTRLEWCIAPRELHTIRTFIQTAQTALAPHAELTPHPDLFAPDDRFLAHCQDSFHHMGGMRMNASPHLGVVDPDLRLHGTPNIFVCSGAVFPTSGFSNPTHTLLALAVRLANHLTS